jgi:hypothetical protein
MINQTQIQFDASLQMLQLIDEIVAADEQKLLLITSKSPVDNYIHFTIYNDFDKMDAVIHSLTARYNNLHFIWDQRIELDLVYCVVYYLLGDTFCE